ncbi:MAG TPA: hypothetical protein VLF94_08100 [Chlamydiales bacterium]|nr:hypothetical protein [Chlamydiales bacterium]
MSAEGRTSSFTLFTNPANCRPSWLYCCGAHSTEESALKEAEAFAPKDASRIVFWHKTLVPEFIRDDSDECLRKVDLVNQLAEPIRKYSDYAYGYGGRASSERQPFTAVGHCYGAELIREALLRLTKEERTSITAITLNGVSMIPNALARTVRNYVYVDDLITDGMNHFFDPSGVLERVKKVYEERIRPGTHSVRQAILRVFAKETHRNLNTMKQIRTEGDEAAKREKSSRFQQLFFGFRSDEIDRKGVAHGLKKLIKPIKDYNIYLMQEGAPAPTKPFGADEELVVDERMCEDAIQEMIDLGKRTLAVHVTSAFAGISMS